MLTRYALAIAMSKISRKAAKIKPILCGFASLRLCVFARDKNQKSVGFLFNVSFGSELDLRKMPLNFVLSRKNKSDFSQKSDLLERSNKTLRKKTHILRKSSKKRAWKMR